jgi:hypothetical protein
MNSLFAKGYSCSCGAIVYSIDSIYIPRTNRTGQDRTRQGRTGQRKQSPQQMTIMMNNGLLTFVDVLMYRKLGKAAGATYSCDGRVCAEQ